MYDTHRFYPWDNERPSKINMNFLLLCFYVFLETPGGTRDSTGNGPTQERLD